MKALLIYFTGTFNTLFLTLKIRRKLLDEGYEVVDSLEVKKDTGIPNLNNYDLIGLGYPIHAFNSPSFFNKYLKKLKWNKEAKYFIYKQSGETFKYNNASSRTIKKILKKNKYEV